MNSLIKHSQSYVLNTVLFIFGSALIFMISPTMGKNSYFALGIFLSSTIILYLLSRAFKFQNATLASAIFINSVCTILLFIGYLPAIGSISFLLSSVSLVLLFVLSKNIYLVNLGRIILIVISTGILACVAMIGIYYLLEANKPATDKIDIKNYINTPISDGNAALTNIHGNSETQQSASISVDETKLQQVKAMFPVGFSFPSDSEATWVSISSAMPNLNYKGGGELSYTTSRTPSEIIATYKKAMEDAGLYVVTPPSRPSDPVGEQSIIGYHSSGRKLDDTYNIEVRVENLPNSLTELNMSVNQ